MASTQCLHAAIKISPSDLQTFLDSTSAGRKSIRYGRGEAIFMQGDPCDGLVYIRSGGVKLSVVSKAGREAVVAVLSPGDIFGEGCLAGQRVRTGSATAIATTVVFLIDNGLMLRWLQTQHALSDAFIAHLLARNIRLEADLVDHLFNKSEKRLARALLLLAHHRKADGPGRVVPRISQDVLAKMVGTTRSRVNFFMNKFKRLGFIEYDGGLRVNDSLLTIGLHDFDVDGSV